MLQRQVGHRLQARVIGASLLDPCIQSRHPYGRCRHIHVLPIERGWWRDQCAVEPDLVEVGHKTLRLLQQRRAAVHLARELGSQHGRKVRVHINARHRSVLPAEQFSRVGHPSRQTQFLEQEVRRRDRRAQDRLADGILHDLYRGQ